MKTAHTEPILQRCTLYRALAEYAGDVEQAETLRKLAAELEAVDQRCFAFAQQFTQGGTR